MENQQYKRCDVIGCDHYALDNDSAFCNDHTGEGLIIKPYTDAYGHIHDISEGMLTLNDYIDCINGQSACNATGLIYTMKSLREKVWNTARYHNKGTEWVNGHPILQLYAYQLAHLCHGREPIEWEGYHSAYSFCKRVRDKEVSPDADYTQLINYK